MDTIITIYDALISSDFAVLSDPKYIIPLYSLLFFILFLENGVIPAAFLPGDSLLFLTGILISQDVFHFGLINIVLVVGAALGTWIGYYQGKWLNTTKIVKNSLANVPQKYHDRATLLFHKYGLQALFIGRFIAFVRTILPIMAGISGLESKRFNLYNWISAILWVMLIVTVGYLLGISPLFDKYGKQIMQIFTIIPIVLLVLGLITSIWLVIQKKYAKKKKSTDKPGSV